MTAPARRAPTRGATPAARGLDPAEEPLELILARNLVSIVSLAAFLVDVDGQIAFYNEAAASIVGRSFEETGTLTREQWNARFGPFDEHGDPLRSDRLPLAMALREGCPSRRSGFVSAGPGELQRQPGVVVTTIPCPCRPESA